LNAKDGDRAPIVRSRLQKKNSIEQIHHLGVEVIGGCRTTLASGDLPKDIALEAFSKESRAE
jgi:hypothetical protein